MRSHGSRLSGGTREPFFLLLGLDFLDSKLLSSPSVGQASVGADVEHEKASL